MKQFVIILAIFLLGFAFAAAQVQYPHPVPPGQEFLVKSGNDTLWIMTNSQINKALVAVKNYDICQQEIELYKKQVENLKQQVAHKDTIIVRTKQMMSQYQEAWDDCKGGLKQVAKSYERCKNTQKLYIITGLTATVAAFIAGAIIF